jgi:ribosomal protein S18 acetylase RimI-like enzyme
MIVRRLAPCEAELLRDVRLRALQDAPMAFGSTYAREVAFEQAEWERRAAANAAGERSVAFVVEPRDGLVVGAIDQADTELAHLYAMWVAPTARGTGAGRALVDAIVGWAIERGARRLETSVAEGNAAAVRLYVAAGFADTGRREPLGHSGGVVAILERPL